MYGTFANIESINDPNVGKDSSPMAHLGMETLHFKLYDGWKTLSSSERLSVSSGKYRDYGYPKRSESLPPNHWIFCVFCVWSKWDLVCMRSENRTPSKNRIVCKAIAALKCMTHKKWNFLVGFLAPRVTQQSRPQQHEEKPNLIKFVWITWRCFKLNLHKANHSKWCCLQCHDTKSPSVWRQTREHTLAPQMQLI